MHRRQRYPRYMGPFVDFWVGFPEFAGDMKLMFICFALLTNVVLLLCFCYSLVQFDLFGVAGPNGDNRMCRTPPQVPFLFLAHNVLFLEHLFYF